MPAKRKSQRDQPLGNGCADGHNAEVDQQPEKSPSSSSGKGRIDPLQLLGKARFFESLRHQVKAAEDRLERLSHAEVDELRQQAVPYVLRVKSKVASALLELGAHLWVVQFAHVKKQRTGEFSRFLKDVGMSRTDAYTAINAFVAFGDCSELEHLNLFAISAMRMLGAPSVPADVRKRALRMAGSGERITVEIARQLIGEPTRRTTKKPSHTKKSFLQLHGQLPDDDHVATIPCVGTGATVTVHCPTQTLTNLTLRAVLEEALKVHLGRHAEGNHDS